MATTGTDPGPDDDRFTGTRAVDARFQMDEARLGAWLGQHVDGFKGPLRLSQFKGGQSNPTYLMETDAKSWVIRSKPGPIAQLLPSAHAIEREFKVQRQLRPTGLPVARMDALCEDESVVGRAFYVMEHVKGQVFWQQSLPELSAHQRGAVYQEMNRVIAALHSVDAAAAGLSDFGKPSNYMARQIDRWSKQYRASELDPIASMDKVIAWLQAVPPPDGGTSVIHGDYRLDNLIFDPETMRIKAILDWELSTLGDPLADFSYHCLGFHAPPSLMRGLAGLDLKALGIPDEAAYRRMYCELTGRSLTAAAWGHYIVYNMFRLCAIAQGVAKRIAVGTAASANAAGTAALVRPLSELALARIEKL